LILGTRVAWPGNLFHDPPSAWQRGSDKIRGGGDAWHLGLAHVNQSDDKALDA
jgi:hypothetical protein